MLGGGLAGAHPLFMDKLVAEMNQAYSSFSGKSLQRLEITVYNLEDDIGFANFKKGDTREITIPFTNRKIKYDPQKRIGVGISLLGTSRAVSIGAYAFALAQLDQKN